ncbi:hypothetical protein [Streptomyces virginiae]|nr:hypothetical protein OG253_00045 [Streptomyces virginiae]WTB27287.1 hypothetical protein OG253_40790 [Streptomyces virginiae]
MLGTLARDYPEINNKVWETAITENAIERNRERAAAPKAESP